MKNETIQLVDNTIYSIETIDQLAIIKFKSDASIEELYKLENSNSFFVEDLGKVAGKNITTRLFIFSNNIFSEARFNVFFNSVKKRPDEKIDFLTLDPNIRVNSMARFVNIKHRFIMDVLESDKLNVFMLEGSSIGLWLSTILAGDFSILSQESEFTFPFLNDDILPLGGLMYDLDNYAPKSTLDDLLLFGKPLFAEKLLEWGLVNRTFPAVSIEEKSIELALEISKKSAFFVRIFKASKGQSKSKIYDWLEKERNFYANRY